jgi:aminoglycoside phosphotransferase (APT) family kinase protein
MPKDPARAPAIRENACFHPAARAWRRAGGDRDPVEIRVLRQGGSGRKQVYWLAGAGPDGGPIIAKLMKRRTAEAERRIYTDVLPRLPVASLRYHGVTDDGAGFCWTFSEYVSGERYSPAREDHRRMAGEWLGLVHGAAVDLRPVGELGARGPRHFFSSLQRTRHAVTAQLESTLEATGAAVLLEVIRALDALEARWADLRELCDRHPPTLVHGDLAPDNLRVCPDGGGARLLVFDWGESGCGPPAVDLTQAVDRRMRFAANPSLDAYRRGFAAGGPAPTMEMLKGFAAVGKVIRSLEAIKWEAREFMPGYHGWDKLLAYVGWMREGMREAGWDRRIADVARVGSQAR